MASSSFLRPFFLIKLLKIPIPLSEILNSTDLVSLVTLISTFTPLECSMALLAISKKA